jgi:hypothetical protein
VFYLYLKILPDDVSDLIIVGQDLGTVQQAILFHTDIDKSAEIYHIPYSTFTIGCQVFHLQDVNAE